MICDGYNEFGELNRDEFVFRPLKRQDRWALGAELMRLPEWSARCVEREVVERQIVACGWGCSVRDMDDAQYVALRTRVLGIGCKEQEIADERNLHRGVYLLVRFPWMETTSCGQCREYQWNPLTGGVTRQTPDGPALRRFGGTLCQIRSKEWGALSDTACPRCHWERPVGLSDKNSLAWKHYQACEAAGAFPDDSIVRRNAGVIRHAIRAARADQAANGGPVIRGGAADQLRHVARAGRRSGSSETAGRTAAHTRTAAIR